MSCVSEPQGRWRTSFTIMNHMAASKPESERYSGFSDASSYPSVVDPNDSEDMVSSHGPQVAVAGGTYHGHSPMIIMNNILLNQPNPLSPVQSWGFPSSLDVLPQSPVVLLQSMVPSSSNIISNNDYRISPKSSSDKHSRTTYLTKPRTYPKICPHPEGSHRTQGASSFDRGTITEFHGRRHRWHHQQKDKLYSLPSHQPRPPTPLQTRASLEAGDTQTELASYEDFPLSQFLDRPRSLDTVVVAFISDEVASAPEASSCPGDQDIGPDGRSTDNHKVKRFSNTYNILKNSGLLDITLRTKELIRQNRSTEGQLQQLQEETDLFVEALSSGDPLVWTRLQQTLQRDMCSARGREGQSLAMDPQGVLE